MFWFAKEKLQYVLSGKFSSLRMDFMLAYEIGDNFTSSSLV
jgi:hypothetical protein